MLPLSHFFTLGGGGEGEALSSHWLGGHMCLRASMNTAEDKSAHSGN